MILQIRRGNRVIAESADFSYSPSLQEVRKLTCEVISVVPIEFKAYNSKSESEYDTVVYNGNTFILYQAPSGDNLNEAGKYKYSLLFYGKEVLLQNVAFLDIVSGTGGEINKIRYTHGGLFQFWGDAKQLAARIEANIQSYNASLGAGYTGIGTWTLNVDAEGELTEDMIDITDGTNLFEALKFFYDKFYLNYYFSTTANGGIITITDKARPSVNWTFKQGDGGGAVKVSSSVDTSTPVITRIILQGGSRNVPPEYKKDAKPADESRYCPYILLPNDSAGNIRYYIDSEYGLKNYGVRGKTISNTFSGIYPSIRGKKLGDLYPSGLPEWDTYKADGEPDPQSGKVAGEGASAATRIDKIIGSTPIKSDDSDSFFIYMTSPGFNLGYKVYEDGDSSDKINDNVQPQYKPHAMFDKYRDFESFDIYGTRVYYDQPVKVTATFSGKMLFSILPIGSDAVGKKVKINLRMVTNRVLGQASPLKEVVIGEEGATGMLEIPYDKTALVGYIEKGRNTTVTIRVEFTFDSDVPAGSCKIGFSEEMTCNIHFGNQDGSQDRFYYKYASVTDAVFSMRTGTYTGTEFKINKNGIIPLYGEVNGDTGETEEDVAMFNKGARYKISCYRTDSDNAKLPLYTDGKSPSIAAGTEFVILNIVMPESYVTMAENTLEKAAIDYLSRYDHENRTVSLDISSGFVAEHPNLFIDFIEGNMLKVRDDGIGVFDFSDNGQIVDMKLQIQSLEIKYSKENMFPSYSCTIARRKILSFYERLAQENQTASTQNTTNVTLGGSGTGSGTNIFSEQLLNDLIASFQKFNGWFEWDEVNQALRCKSAFYTNQWISALGAQSGGGSPGGGGIIQSVYGFADLGKTFNNDTLTDTFNAYTINEIWKLAKEGGMNADKLWQELGKDDATKKIHISHLPDNKYVTIDTEQTVTANKIFTGQLSTANIVPSVNNASTLGLDTKRWENIYSVSANISGTITSNNVKTNSLQVGDIKIVYDSTNKAVTFEHIDGSTTIGLYTKGWISALGVSPGGGSGGSGLINNVYGYSSLGTIFSDTDLNNTFNAYTINEIWKMAKEGGGIKNITQSGSGNAVTNMALSSDGKTITAVFGETFARQQDLGTLNNTVTQLSNKLNNFLEGSDADNIINKWKELEAFLDGLTESDNLAELLALKADKTITISAGTGLTGGGNLSANRTLSLATTGVKAGTYTKVTVDTYGRVTVGDNPTTLAGYGITDAVTLTTAQTISGQKTFTKNILMNSGTGLSYAENTVFRNTSGNTIIASYGDGMIYFRPNGHNNTEGSVWISKTGYLNGVSAGFTGKVTAAQFTASDYVQIGDAYLKWDAANNAVYVVKKDNTTPIGFYATSFVSAKGIQQGGSSEGGAIKTVYSFANLTDGTIFSDTDLNNTFNAYTIKKIYDMAGQGGLDATAMWNELKKADSSKVIDASHIPTSVLDGRWVTLSTNQTITGQKTFTQNILFSNNITGIRNTAGNLVFGAGNENIFCILNDYVGPVEAKTNQLVLGNDAGYWKKVTAGQYISKVATGLSPLIVSSNTLVNNLNADLLDGYHQSSFLRADGVNQYVTLSGGNGNNEGYRLVFEGTVTGGWSINSMTLLVNSRHAGTGMISIVFHTTNQDSTSYTGSLNYYGSTISLGDTMWRLFYNTTTKKVRLFWRFYDHSDCQVSILNRRGITTNISNRTWYTTIPSDSGSELPAYYNWASSAHALATSRTLWGQPFNGTANVSGNMTGVGNITMSGQLTSTVASGTAPFIVVSNTVVGNLNADMVDGLHLSDFDGRYVNVTGDTMTGDLTMNNTKGFNIGGGTRVVKTSSNWIHGGGDAASSTDANLRFGSWQGIGWYPTIDSTSGVRQGNNAMWLNVRTGVLNVAGGIKESNICIGRVDSNGNYNINCAGEISRYDHHLYLQRNSGKNLIMCTGGGLAGIGTDSPGEKLHVAGNTRTDGYFRSTVGTGTQPYQCSSTTLNTNLNADLLDGYHISQISLGYPSGHIKHRVGPFGGGQDKNWRKIVTYVNTTGGQYKACTIIGTIWINHGNHSQGQVTEIPFQVVLYAYGGTANSQVNGNYLYIPPYCTFDCIRIVRYASNSWELQIRQYSDWTTINCEYSAFSTGGGTINAGQFSTDIHTSTVTNAYNSNVTTPQSHSVWGVTRTFYIQDYHSVNTGAGVSVNGGSNCYLKLPSTTRFSRIDFSTPNANIRHSGNDNGNEVGSSTLSNLVIDSWHGVSFTTTCSSTYQNKIAMSVNCRTGRVTANNFHAATNITANGAITAKASSSDIRLKTDIQGYDAMGIIRKFRSVKYHWNAIAKENSEVFNHDNWNYGLIAQDLLSGGYSQWVKDTFNDYYTIDYERLIPVVWKGLQEVDDEVTRLKKRVRELEKRLGINN